VQDYESLSTAVMICATLVNTHTHTQTRRQTAVWPTTLLAQPAELMKPVTPKSDGHTPCCLLRSLRASVGRLKSCTHQRSIRQF